MQECRRLAADASAQVPGSGPSGSVFSMEIMGMMDGMDGMNDVGWSTARKVGTRWRERPRRRSRTCNRLQLIWNRAGVSSPKGFDRGRGVYRSGMAFLGWMVWMVGETNEAAMRPEREMRLMCRGGVSARDGPVRSR